jgi:2,3-diaminopropionate biosynthesis protein SbnA
MIINKLTDISSKTVFYALDNFIKKSTLYLKLEGLNIAGSIKLKPAIWLVNQLEKQGTLVPGLSTVVCSSSGNLGIALSIVCKEKNYPLICVSDVNISPISKKTIELFGGKLILINRPDDNGGYLKNRIDYIKKLLATNAHYAFVDQYANQENVTVHFATTALEIAQEIPTIDFLFVGAGTTGTLMGCAKYFKEYFPKTKIIAVDSVGSVTFGMPPAKRFIPGLGTSYPPEIVDKNCIDDLIMVPEIKTISMCHELVQQRGLLLGGSSGTVLQGVRMYQNKIPAGSIVVAISPDFGDRYIHTIYDEAWLEKLGLLESVCEVNGS